MIDHSIAFISDLHLDRQDSLKNQQFQAVCAWMRNHVGDLYILGDLWDAWLGDDSLMIDEWQSGYSACVSALHELSQERSIYFMVGNRDFLASTTLIQKSGMTPLDDPSVITLPNSNRALLTHGDAWCLDDHLHIATIPKIRHPEFVKNFLTQSMRDRVALLGNYQRSEDKGNLDIDSACAHQHVIQAHAQTLIHGHTHRPAYHPAKHDRKWDRFVLHNWDVCPGMLAWKEGQGLQLFDFKFSSSTLMGICPR